MSDMKNGMDAGLPVDGALDGDASGEAVQAGVVPGGNEGLPGSSDRPPQDGGIMGATTGSSSGETETPGVNDKGGDLPPEEMDR
jgi:hypothetical protein